jgi:hypothetical protein
MAYRVLNVRACRGICEAERFILHRLEDDDPGKPICSFQISDIVNIIDDNRVGQIVSCGIAPNGVMKYHVVSFDGHGYYEEWELEKI